jgi:hypothetical protein
LCGKVEDEQIMNQRQVIVSVVVVGLMSAAVWAWHVSAQQEDLARVPAKSSAPLRDAFYNPAAPAGSTALGAVTTTTPQPAAPALAAPEADKNLVSAQAQVPPDVDTPEPAERKFAHGVRADDSNQSPN